MDSNDETVYVERESPRKPEVVDLISQLDAYVSGLYPAESNHLLDIDALCAPEIRFFVARSRGAAVGCGAIRVDPNGYGEVKRMFVRPDVRGKGVGRAILRGIELEARNAKLPCVRLETGPMQVEALRLYQSEGYREIPPFGSYLPDPLSVFMEKHIDEAGEHRDAAAGTSRLGVKSLLKITGLAALGLSILLGFADLMGWLKHSDRQAVLEWFLESNVGLPIEDPAARAFMKAFPPPPESKVDEITHLTKQVIRSEGGPVMDGSVNYMQRDTIRTKYVATLAEVREWAAESTYPWIAWVLGLVGFLEVLTSILLERRS